MGVIPYEEARGHVVERCRPLAPAERHLDDALGCVLADAAVASEPVPPFANSAMDGYAVRAVDVEGAGAGRPVRLEVVGTIAAGDPASRTVEPGTAARIMTGAPMPPGADAVVMVERATVEGRHVLLTEAVDVGRHVRPVGDDIAAGDEVVAAGTVLTAAHLGVLASVGRRRPLVVPRPRVGVFSTGDELVDEDRPLARGEIRESNRPALVAAARGFGVDAVDLGTVRDDPVAIREAIEQAAADCDAVVTSGGVSMGDFDLVKVVLDEIAEMRWMQVAIRPAKPFAFGVLDGTPVFGLPGNPVSSLVSLAVLAVPGLRVQAGRADLDLPRVTAVSTTAVHGRPDGRTTFVRVRLTWDGSRFEADPVERQGSHQLAATAGANGLAVVPDGGGLEAGATVPVVLLRDPFGP